VSQYQKGKTNLDFTEAKDSEWQWHQLDHMQVCTLLQTDNHANTPPLSFLQAGCPSCRPTNSVKALKANLSIPIVYNLRHRTRYLFVTIIAKFLYFYLYGDWQVRPLRRHIHGFLAHNINATI